MSYAAGALVKARDREWVVLPESTKDLLMLRPLGGAEAEVTGIYLPLEKVESASFPLPDPEKLGDHVSSRLLRDAVRLGFRSSAGPFRSFAQLAVEPRPYQLVPLLLALKLDPVRLLIADDVGIGKTVESLLIARELLDRGEAKRLAVLCPPHLAEQWQAEMKAKFHIDAELVLASTASRLERHCGMDQSIFDLYPFVVVSTDFIKSDRRREDFIRTCPDLVIVDEAHTCAFDGTTGSGRHQRHQLLKKLAEKEQRHLILVTATPHSGKEATFRSLLSLLRPEFANLPDDLSGKGSEAQRRQVAQHLIQRRRGDIRSYLDADTPFPKREEQERTWQLDADAKKFFEDVLDYAQESIKDPESGDVRQRVRWWAVLGLLRAMASSPAAAAASLRNRVSTMGTTDLKEVERIGREEALDADEEDTDVSDRTPGAQVDAGEVETSEQKRLRALADRADELRNEADPKLSSLLPWLKKELLSKGHNPILFCRFIDTAEYVAEYLRGKLEKQGIEVVAVTGKLPPADREERVAQLAQAKQRILVATDCLSEGINLQEHFDAIVHYDLAWNPTRHEQREGRVDRYGQPKKNIRVITYLGKDNLIDGIVLTVLLRKHKSIRSALGVSVPVPVDTDAVIKAVYSGILQLKKKLSDASQLDLFDLSSVSKVTADLDVQWKDAEEREKRSQTMFAQYGIKVDEVQRELAAVRGAIGSHIDVERFVKDALHATHAVISEKAGQIDVELKDVPSSFKEAIGEGEKFKARFEMPVEDGVLYLQRTHPMVERLANLVMTTALDPLAGIAVARRSGVIETKAVEKRTTLLLVRNRFHILTKSGTESWTLLAEDCQTVAYRGAAEKGEWLSPEETESLLGVSPSGNVNPDSARDFVRKALEPAAVKAVQEYLMGVAEKRGAELLDAHQRVREASKLKGVRHSIQVAGVPDLLGVFILLPGR